MARFRATRTPGGFAVSAASQSHGRHEAAVSVENLRVRFVGPEQTVYAVNGVDFQVARGETVALLGESGCGKSVTLRALMRLLPRHATRVEGRISISGEDVMRLDAGGLRKLRGGTVAMIFQEPMTALDPVYRVGDQIAQAIRAHAPASHADARARALRMMERVQIASAASRMNSYPHELSGGLRQRVMIAIALSADPSVLLADEPTTALDVTVQMQILLLLRELRRESGMAVLFVTHDIAVAAEVADRVIVMYGGQVVEAGPASAVLKSAAHPYTRGLLAASVRDPAEERLPTIAGAPPRFAAPPAGCVFAGRCHAATARCMRAVPPIVRTSEDHLVRCVLHAD